MKKLAIVTGIDEYTFRPLRYAVADAEAVQSALELPEYGYDVISLINSEATRSRMIQVLREADAYRPDKFVFYFAGHGVVTDYGAFIATFDTSADEEGLELNELNRYLDKLSKHTSQVVSVLDCCHAGESNPWQATRALAVEDVSEFIPAITDTKVVLAACRTSESARERSESGHGVFTSALVDGMIGGAVDFNGNVTVGSLHEFVALQVAGDTDGQQVLLRGDIGAQVVLGEGLQKRLGAPIPSDELKKTLGTAQQLLDEYDRLFGRSQTRWREAGHLECSQRLQAVQRWFATQRESWPEIQNDARYKGLLADLQNRVSQLGSIGVGTRLNAGIFAEKVGSGGFGSVWRVVSSEDGKVRAFKVFHAADFDEKDKLDLFSRGYRAMQQLDHPHIVKVGEYSEAPVGFYMDFIDGPNLRQLPNLISDDAERLRILILVAETIQHAHGRRVIHRDIKPENILLRYDQSNQKWIPYLTDFDLAWFSTATSVTQKSFGNLFYASPEQLAKPSSGAARSPAVDIFAFGQLAFFVMTGSNPTPFASDINISVLRDRITDWPSAKAARDFLDWYRRASADAPEDRFSSFQKIISALTPIEMSLRAPDADASLTPGQFVTEVAFGLSGFAAMETAVGEAIRSPSGRTQLEFLTKGPDTANANIYTFLATVSLDVLEMEGVTSERAAALTLRRVNSVIADLTNVTRRSARHRGEWAIELSISEVVLNYSSAVRVRQIVSSVVEAVERL